VLILGENYMFKKIWNYSLSYEDWLGDWPNWLRWILSIPLSFLTYSIFFWIVNLNNFNIISDDTFFGYLFMDFFSSTIPLFVFYHIAPHNKATFSFAFAVLIIFLHLILLFFGIVLLLEGYSIFSDELMTFIPNIITTIGTLLCAKIFLNSKSEDKR